MRTQTRAKAQQPSRGGRRGRDGRGQEITASYIYTPPPPRLTALVILVTLVTLVILVIFVIVMVSYITFIMNVIILGRGAGGVLWVQGGSLKIVLLLVLKTSAVGRFICSYAVGALFLCFVSIWWLRVPSAQPWQCCFALFSNQFSVGRSGWPPVGRAIPFVL